MASHSANTVQINPGNSSFTLQQLQSRASVFVHANLLTVVMGLIFFVVAFGLAEQSIPILLVAFFINTLCLIPYDLIAKRAPHSIETATLGSLAVSISGVTFAAHFAGIFDPKPLIFDFVFLPLGCLVIPHSRMVRTTAGIALGAYFALLAIDLVSAPMNVWVTSSPILQGRVIFTALFAVTLWTFAVIIGRIVDTLEGQRIAQIRWDDKLRLQAETESIWRTVGKTVVSNQTLDQVLSTVIQIIKEKTQVEAGAILLLDPETQQIGFAKVLQTESPILSSTFLKPGEGIAGWVIQQGQSALVPDVTQDPRWQRRVDKQTGFQTRSILCVPLIAQDETIGAIELLNKTNGDFIEADLELLESLAAPLAIAIQNSRLRQQVLHQLNTVTKMLGTVEHAKKEWEQTVDAIDSGIWFVDTECRIVRSNRTLASWFNTTPKELVGQYCYQAIHRSNTRPEFCPMKHEIIDATIESSTEIQLSARPGRILRFNTYPLRYPDGMTAGSVNVLRDITTELALQSQLFQSEKLAAIGRLAGSIAHEINNPLQALQGCLDLALANPNNVEKQARYLNVAKNEVERLATLVQRMLDFYRPSKGTRGPIDVQELIEEVLILSGKRLQHAQVTTHLEWETHPAIVTGIANQLKQVFLNLVLNAIDAMPNGGKLKIRGHIVEKERTWLAVDFADTGVGISQENLDKIFEPFYTTKTSGTGLGLGISHTILTSHGGQMTVESTLGTGTTFTVWLPIDSTGTAPRDMLVALR